MDEFFLQYVDKNGSVPEHRPELGPCWEWNGHKDKRLGYAKFSKRLPGHKHSQSFKAHRYAYEQFIGPIPDGKVLDHLCRNRGCVNPYHTEPVTQLENMQRGAWKIRTHCKHGHLLVHCPWNINRRYCPDCQRKSHREAYHTRKGKVG